MKKRVLTGIFLLFIGFVIQAQNIANKSYPNDPATQRQEGIVSGEIIEKQFSDSKIYPGTQRTYWIYVPAGYNPQEPGCLYVCMDGIQHNAPIVFDNLIASGEMPVTIGVFVGPGKVVNEENEVLRFNRSNEFDRIDDTFARFLKEELLPDAEVKKTRDGRIVQFSKDPNDRAIAGSSSGAISAFKTAWQRPDMFSGVFSSIGTYVAMRRGNKYPYLIRKTEPKPLRIFLEDNINDVWNPLFGNWHESNLLMESALNFAGYELANSWGRGGHDATHATAIFPDVMRWLWKGWPKKIQQGTSLNNMLSDITLKGQDWEQLDIPTAPSGELFVDGMGRVMFQNGNGVVYKIDQGGQIIHKKQFSAGEYLIGANQKEIYVVDLQGTISRWESDTSSVIAKGIKNAKKLLETFEKDMYVVQATDPENLLWLIRQDVTKRMINCTDFGGSHIAVYPNHELLMQTEKNSRWIYSNIIDPDGSLKDGQRFYYLHNTDNFDLMNMEI